MKESKLKRCPFCGDKVSMVGHDHFYMIQCYRCGAMTSFKVKITQKECLERWNTRVIEEKGE